MLKILMGTSQFKTGNALEGFDMEKALKRIPTKDLAIMTFKQMNDHVNICAQNSASTLKAIKFVGWVVFALALEKVNEIFHFVSHLPAFPPA